MNQNHDSLIWAVAPAHAVAVPFEVVGAFAPLVGAVVPLIGAVAPAHAVAVPLVGVVRRYFLLRLYAAADVV